MVWAGSIWLRIGAFGLHKILGSSEVAAQLVASEEGLSLMKLVSLCELSEQTRKKSEIQKNKL
jgi:hypothetical protein